MEQSDGRTDLDDDGLLWTAIDYDGLWQIATDFDGLGQTAMDCDELNCDWLPRTVTGCKGLQWTATDWDGLPRSTTNCNGLARTFCFSSSAIKQIVNHCKAQPPILKDSSWVCSPHDSMCNCVAIWTIVLMKADDSLQKHSWCDLIDDCPNITMY